MDYSAFRYYYPPRPKANFPADQLSGFEEGGKYLAQPKLNGSCCLIFTNGKEFFVYNRHKQVFDTNFKLSKEEILSLHRGEGWMVLVGEYMNKACKDEKEKLWNHKYCIFDILVHNGKYLLGSTIIERVKLLESIYKTELGKPLIRKIIGTENMFIVDSFPNSLKEVYDAITKWNMFEGLVLKNKTSKLVLGLKETSDASSQIKCRKPTKNYSY